jgi:hypothetical protein
MPFRDLDLLFSRLLATCVKKDGQEYPSGTYMNMVNSLSRILCEAAELRAIEGRGSALDPRSNIKKSLHFPKCLKVIRAAVKKAAREGKNVRKPKVQNLALAMETAILADVDHQINSSAGCQKRLAFYIMCRLEIFGGSELHKMQGNDLKVITGANGKEFIV